MSYALCPECGVETRRHRTSSGGGLICPPATIGEAGGSATSDGAARAVASPGGGDRSQPPGEPPDPYAIPDQSSYVEPDPYAVARRMTADEALGVALSVASPLLVMDEAQERAPAMREHLRRLGYDLTPAGRPR